VRSSASFVSFISESGKSKVSLGLRRETSGGREQPAIPVQISLKPRNGVSEDEGEDEGEEEETDGGLWIDGGEWGGTGVRFRMGWRTVGDGEMGEG